MEDNIKKLTLLLQKYIQHIVYCEGIDYLSDGKIERSEVKFTNEEIEILRSF